ncbi:hypothetical protein [Shewanella morhuae]|nr:hypothetical protein [Shewanella morhuae]
MSPSHSNQRQILAELGSAPRLFLMAATQRVCAVTVCLMPAAAK